MKVTLLYRRVNRDGCTGSIVRDGDMPLLFDCISFNQMMVTLSRVLQGLEGAEVVVQRTDRPGIPPYALGPVTIQLLTTDPDAAIAGMQYPESPSVQVQRAQRPTVTAPEPLRAGYDVLADAFGEEVYCRVREGQVECPGCGLWAAAHRGLVQCRKPSCAFFGKVSVVLLRGQWAAFAVKELLQSSGTRFFLPRAWNAYRPWVSREDLQALFDEYTQQKKEEVTCYRKEILDR